MGKKITALFLACVMLMGITACGSKPAASTPAAPSAPAASTPAASKPAEAPKTDFPKGSVTWIVPVAAGSGADTHGRKLASIVERYLGVSIVIENVAGGNQAVGTQQMLSKAADGYTICQTSPSLSTLLIDEAAPFKMEDFRFLCAFNAEPNGFTVRGDSGWKSLEEVIEYAKANPGKLVISSSGSGSNQHLTIQLLADQAGFEYTYVPYDGGKEAVVALLGENCQAIGVTPANCVSNYESGELVLLGVSGSDRMSKYPDAVAYSELGYDVPVINWRGMLCSANVPQDVYEILLKAFEDAIADPEWVKFNQEQGQLDGYVKMGDDFKDLVAATNEAFKSAAASIG